MVNIKGRDKMNFKKMFGSVTALITAASIITVPLSSYAQEENKIVVGTDGTTAGYTFLNEDNELAGFEIDVWNEIGERTGYEIEFDQMPFSSLFGLLDDGRIDVIANVITPTDERRENYDFSEPYMYDEDVFMAGSDLEAEAIEDIDGFSVGVVAGSADEIIIDKVEEEYGITLERVNYDDTAMNDVIAGKVDLAVQSASTGYDFIQQLGDDKVQILIGTGFYGEYAYPFNKDADNKELIDLINETLAEMKADGTLAEISMKWFDADLTTDGDEADDNEEVETSDEVEETTEEE